MPSQVRADPVEEVTRLLTAADAEGIPLRAIGGLAVAIRAPSVRQLFPDRTYHDIDLVAPSGQNRLPAFLEEHGYLPQRRFNKLNGAERLLFHDLNGRRLDVFVGRLRMCHELSFAERIPIDPLTLPLADLLLSKLQIVQPTPRDRQDLVALLADHPLSPDDAGGIGLPRVESVCASSWGWWRTVTGGLQALNGNPDLTSHPHPAVERALARAGQLLARLASVRGGWRWQLRSWIGDRLGWYDEPEEVR